MRRERLQCSCALDRHAQGLQAVLFNVRAVVLRLHESCLRAFDKSVQGFGERIPRLFSHVEDVSRRGQKLEWILLRIE